MKITEPWGEMQLKAFSQLSATEQMYNPFHPPSSVVYFSYTNSFSLSERRIPTE